VAASGLQSTALPQVPAKGAYFGVVPNASPPTPTAAQAVTLEKTVKRAFGIVSFYVSWGSPPPIAGLSSAASVGSIPMVSMHCGPADAAVAAGEYDGLLRADAEAYRAYGRPVLLRWFWEMNLTKEGHHPVCLGTSSQAGDYVAAWKRIWTIFHEVGARNVAFVWTPSDALHAGSPASYYPGSAYVDWVGADLYDRPGYGPFPNMFSSFYSTWIKQHKPMILSETGAVGSAAQATWIGQIAKSVPTQFPGLRAVVYTDGNDGLGNYILQPGTAGMAAFAALGHDAFFSVMR